MAMIVFIWQYFFYAGCIRFVVRDGVIEYFKPIVEYPLQIKIMRILVKVAFLLIAITVFNSCRYVVAFAMAKEEKTTIIKWKDDKYKVRIQVRRGWSGPHYYHCRIMEKKLGGLFYSTIISETFSRETYGGCVINYPIHSDTISVDICNKTTIYNSKMKVNKRR